MNALPQYARSTDPDVIAAVERNRQHEADFREKVAALSEKWTGDPGNAWIDRGSNGSTFTGLRMTREQVEAAPGQWKKPDRLGSVRPYKSNPIAPEFSIRAKYEQIPGRPGLLWGENWMGKGLVFLHAGAAWSGVSFVPDHDTKGIGGWTEVLASEFHAAMEAINAERKDPS